MTCPIGQLVGGFDRNGILPLAEIKAMIFFNDPNADLGVLNPTGAADAPFTKIETLIGTGDAFYASLEDYEPTTDDANIITTQATNKYQTNYPKPSYTAFLKGGFCNLKDIFSAFNGKMFGVVYILEGDVLMASEATASGEIAGTSVALKPYEVSLNTQFKGALKGDIQNSFPVMIFHQSYDEMVLSKIKKLSEPALNLQKAMLLPINVLKLDTSAAPVVSVTIDPSEVATLTDSDIEVLVDSWVDPVTVTLVAAGAGAGEWDITFAGGGEFTFRILTSTGLSRAFTIII